MFLVMLLHKNFMKKMHHHCPTIWFTTIEGSEAKQYSIDSNQNVFFFSYVVFSMLLIH